MTRKNLFNIAVLFLLASTACCLKNEESELDLDVNEVLEDSCKNIKCSSGQECITDPETNEGKCVCIRECAENSDLRRRVCSNFNDTWQSDCHLLKHRCDCIEGNTNECSEDQKHMHINYYGECKEIEPCQKDILEDFPRRMREWLDNIISKRVKVNNSKEKLAHKWIDAIIWKFCDMDQEPHDRFVSRHELFPLRAPLLSMESCISDFLDNCDINDDHKITLAEWGKCLGASDNEMEDKCNQFMSIGN